MKEQDSSFIDRIGMLITLLSGCLLAGCHAHCSPRD